MRPSCQLLAIGVLYLMPLASMTQEAVPYANSEVKVDWVRGTDFSKYKTYAWGTPNQKAPDPNHPLDDIEAALQAEGLQKVGPTQIRISSSLLALAAGMYMFFSTSPKIQS